MKTYFYNILALILLHTSAFGQAPNWQVNESQYQYTMSFAAFLNVNGTTLSSTNDKVGAFVNGELRGSANLLYVSSTDRYLAYFLVFANTINETIDFKIYDSVNNQIVNATTTINFQIDKHYGNVFQAFGIANTTLSNQANILDFSFDGAGDVNKTITSNKVTIDSNVFISQNIIDLNAIFQLSPGATLYDGTQKIVSGSNTFNFTNSKILKVLSQDETILKEWTVEVVIVDRDSDGYNSDIDCDDSNATINPGATEILNNGLDDDCNPLTLDVLAGITNETGTTILNCSTTAVSVTATGGVIYSWYDGLSELGTEANFLITEPGNYTVTVTNSSGFSDTASITITENTSFVLAYTANTGGIIIGTTPQTVRCYESGSSVEAIPNTGYVFIDWSDGLTTNPRTDTNIDKDISVTANFDVALDVSEFGITKFKIYPNPVDNVLKIITVNNGTIGGYEIFDALGRRVLFDLKNNTNAIDVSTLYNGVYLIKIKTDKRELTARFIKI
ncbi:MAG: T9SS type A sorting domain-containing protein [Flavobacteriaceae bacterium]|nr:T9SS type A sorting domain-containing protein [Flavobacteriaceae bacterium]